MIYNLTANNQPFSPSVKDAVWAKADSIAGVDPTKERSDPCGARIRYSEYGKQSAHGWEIDHKKPKSKGGTDDPANLQALHWKKNRSKGDMHPAEPWQNCKVLNF